MLTSKFMICVPPSDLKFAVELSACGSELQIGGDWCAPESEVRGGACHHSAMIRPASVRSASASARHTTSVSRSRRLSTGVGDCLSMEPVAVLRMRTPHEHGRRQQPLHLAAACCRTRSAPYWSDDESVVKMLEIEVPTPLTAVRIAIAMPAAIKPYSTAVAADSCLMKRETRFFMLAPDRHWLREPDCRCLDR